MNILNLLLKSDINKKVDEYKNTKGAVLVDVRTKEEYKNGHIPGSINIPLQSINRIRNSKIKSNTPLYVYCQSGSRSVKATSLLKNMGYTIVNNIGGIISYKGELTI